LFEVASEDRLKILALLKEGASRLTEIAKKLSATDPEASRHLSRLSKAGLVARTADGTYTLTPLGRLACEILPAFEILAIRREYLLSHDLSSIPSEFLRRIGELVEHRYLDHLDEVLGLAQEVTAGATEYVWILTDRPVPLEHKHPRPGSLSVRCIIPRSFDEATLSLLRQNWPGANLELAYLEAIPAAMVLNERQAGILFHGLDRRIDWNGGLSGGSAAFHGWCRDLFEELWARARKALL
jgi:predicted transcriptional regulator